MLMAFASSREPAVASCSSISLSFTSTVTSKLFNATHSLAKLLTTRSSFSLVPLRGTRKLGSVRALVVDPSDSAQESMDKFIARVEKAWLISKQPKPIPCTSCSTEGCIECQWCKGTGFFILGDNMLCEVPSRNTTCRICLGQGSVPCKDCKGTGYRARWLGDPPPNTNLRNESSRS